MELELNFSEKNILFSLVTARIAPPPRKSPPRYGVALSVAAGNER